MKKYTLLFLIALITSCMATSCSEDTDPVFEEENFTTIFDNNDFNASYIPIDIQQTPDGGYLVLCGRRLESNFNGISLLKADKQGNFVKELEVEESFVNAVPSFKQVNGKFYFFCMAAADLQAHLAEVGEDLDSIAINPLSNGGVTYPAASEYVDNHFILLGYNHVDKQSVVSMVTTAGAVSSVKQYSIGIGDEVEEPIMDHYVRTGRQYPFQVGKVSEGMYFFSGFYNYTFSLVFTDLSSDDPTGVVQGQDEDGGFSAVMPLQGNKFATSTFIFGDNYLLPNVTLNLTGETSVTDLPGYSIPELVPDSRVKILRATINDKRVLIYGADTKSKQIGLLFYDEETGTFMSSRYLGFSNPFEIANLIQTEDGGLAVCGTTYLAGRFPRVCIFKLSKSELSSQLR